MRKSKVQTRKLHTIFQRKILSGGIFFAFVLLAAAVPFFFTSAQEAVTKTPEKNEKNEKKGIFRIGERITYNISFGNFGNVGYAEIYAVSDGKLSGRDAVELRAKIKTSALVSAAFFELDETRTTFASTESGLPLLTKKVQNSSVLPKETTKNYLTNPATNFDLVSLIYHVRQAGGAGNFTFQEDDRIFNLSLQTAGSERVKTDEGEFETNVSTAQSEFFNEIGIRELKFNFSADENKIPVLIRFKTQKGEFRAALASLQLIEPEVEIQPTPAPVQTPRPAATPKPVPTPTPYQENQPLLSELPFVLGETLDFQLTQNSRNVGAIRLQARERKQFQGQDSLFLSLSVTNASPDATIFRTGDSINANVNPDTLAPQQIEIKFNGTLGSFNQMTQFDQRTGIITQNGANRMEAPVGTHSLLSLVYAIRSFNLKPSKDPNNPVNDTRVAVFLDTMPYIFILRPANAELINLSGEKVSAQMITVVTGNQQIDQLGLRVWLGNDDKRLPLRFSFGNFQADLIAETLIPPK